MEECTKYYGALRLMAARFFSVFGLRLACNFGAASITKRNALRRLVLAFLAENVWTRTSNEKYGHHQVISSHIDLRFNAMSDCARCPTFELTRRREFNQASPDKSS